MPKGIDRFVSENRRATKRIDSTFVEVSSQRRQQFDLGISRFEITTSVEVYTRPLNKGLVSGHPNPQQGSGRGTSGDERGEWTLQTDEVVSEEFLKIGRNAIRDSLSGELSGAIDRTVVGNGSDEARVSNTQLQSKTGDSFAWAFEGDNAKTTTARSHYLFNEFSQEIEEMGAESGGGDLFNRITIPTIETEGDQELRIDIHFEISGSGRGNSAITNDGMESVAESIRNPYEIIGLQYFTFGDGNSPPSPSNSSLDNQIFEKAVENQIEPEIVTPHTVVFETEPENQPHTLREIGIKDNSGRLVWRSLIDDYNKDDTVEFEVFAGFRAK